MEDPGTVLVLGAVVYVLCGGLVGAVSARRIARLGDTSPRRRVRTFAWWLGRTRTGTAAAVLLWPLVATAVHWGFILGAWDWKGRPDDHDPR